LFGKWINIPRKQTAFGDSGTTYTFSGNTVPAREWPPFLLAVRERVAIWLSENIPEIFDPEVATNYVDPHPNFVLVNLYKNGTHYIGPHSDDEKDLAKLGPDGETIIVSLSFGATRDFVFQNKTLKLDTKTFQLSHGDICVMRGKTQQFWRHSIPKKTNCKTARVNLTFRFMRLSNNKK
jgi:alkylated DNA repair dioxygenase AlkB